MKKKSGCASWVLALALVAAVTLGLDVVGRVVDRWRFPWAYAESGNPTLTGTWVGQATTGSGKRVGMFLDIQMAPLDYHRKRGTAIRTQRNSWLIGRALACPSPGTVQRFIMWGTPDDKATGARFHLALSQADSLSVPDGLAPSHIRGRWDLANSLVLDVSLHLRRGKSAITSSDDPDTGRDSPATLKRGTEAEFTALCRRA
jgi:hypothetical protein